MTKSNSSPLLSHKEDNPYPSPIAASYPISSAQASKSSSKVTTAVMAHFKPKPYLPNAHLNSRPQHHTLKCKGRTVHFSDLGLISLILALGLAIYTGIAA